MNRAYILVLFIALQSCIGTDIVDDPIIGERIETPFSQVSLLIDSTATVTATYFDQVGIAQNYQLTWTSANDAVASIDAGGTITGISPGQTFVNASLNTAISDNILVTVVATIDEVGQVIISSPSGNQVASGAGLSLQIEVLTVMGVPVSGAEVTWMSSDNDVLTVSNSGEVSGISNGTAQVWAVANGVQSNVLNIIVGNTERTGTFSSANGYLTSGSARLFYSDNGDLMLELSDNFQTSFALGTFVYLSNSVSGSATAAGGLEIAGITTNGYKLFNVTAVNSSVTIDTYSRVIILCKPASITFGHALMQ
jgi:hypothetical protein